MINNHLAYDVTLLEREFADLIAAFPELAEDEDLRADTIEGETDAHRVLARIVAIEREADSMVKAIAERARELSGRKARHERKKDAMRTLLMRLLKAAGLPRVALPEATVSISKGRDSVEVLDVEVLPDNVVRITKEADKKALADLLKAGPVEGARLVTGGETLTVRAA